VRNQKLICKGKVLESGKKTIAQQAAGARPGGKVVVMMMVSGMGGGGAPSHAASLFARGVLA
jgi:hypothetical protein